MAQTSLDKIGAGNGYGYGDGYGAGNGYGYGDGYGAGNRAGNGDGYGFGYGFGYGSLELLREFLAMVRDQLTSQWVLRETNQELKRVMIEAMGIDRFFAGLNCSIIHSDIDGCGNPRSLLRIPMANTQRGYLQAVRVICPTTGRIYNLGVPSSVTTCQEAVASTFGITADKYQPDRES